MALGPAGLVWLGLNLGGVVCTPTTGEITFTGNVPTVVTPQSGLAPHPLPWLGLNLARTDPYQKSPATGVVSFTGNVAGVDLPAEGTSPGTGVIAFTGNVPVVLSAAGVLTTTGVITFTGYQPAVSWQERSQATEHELPVYWMADPGYAARYVHYQQGIAVHNRDSVGTFEYSPETGVVTFEGNVSEILSGGVTAMPGTGELEFTGERTALDLPALLAPQTGLLTFIGNVPGINTESLVQPVTGEITFTGNVPAVDAESTITCETGEILFEGNIPGVDAQEQQYMPTEGVIVFYGNQPVIDGAVDTASLVRKKDGGFAKPAAKKKDRRYVVEIDGEEFVVESAEEAQALLDAAKELAEQKAKEEAAAIVAKRFSVARESGKPLDVSPVTLEQPKAISDSEALQNELNAVIAAAYQRAEVEAEIAVRLAKQRLADEEDNILMLLLND